MLLTSFKIERRLEMESKNKRNKILIARWGLYTLVLLLAAALQSTPGFLAIGECKPYLILGVCVAVSMQENEFDAALFGAVGGLLWDYTAGRTVGFFAISMLFICFLCSILMQLYLKRVPANIFLINFLAGLFLISMDFLFGYLMTGYAEPAHRYLYVLLPEVVASAILALISMWMIRVISEKFTLD